MSSGKKRRMTFAERIKITQTMQDMVSNENTLLPAKDWTALAAIIKQLTGLPAYGGLMKEIADAVGLSHESLVVRKQQAPSVDHNAMLGTLTERINSLEAVVHSMSGMLKNLSETVVELSRQSIVPEMPPPQVPPHTPRHTFMPPDIQCGDE